MIQEQSAGEARRLKVMQQGWLIWTSKVGTPWTKKLRYLAYIGKMNQKEKDFQVEKKN